LISFAAITSIVIVPSSRQRMAGICLSSKVGTSQIANYDYANLVTAAGYATIGTGAYTSGHRIPLNEWYERTSDGELRQVSSVADDRYKLVGEPKNAMDLTGALIKHWTPTTIASLVGTPSRHIASRMNCSSGGSSARTVL
jgi:hypothetical protein